MVSVIDVFVLSHFSIEHHVGAAGCLTVQNSDQTIGHRCNEQVPETGPMQMHGEYQLLGYRISGIRGE